MRLEFPHRAPGEQHYSKQLDENSEEEKGLQERSIGSRIGHEHRKIAREWRIYGFGYTDETGPEVHWK
ncbi:hypothetical protein SKAU_G00125590 [Synaphobranchus kaupii]|uniref:Uncharacterized protein n=1 Tax=Synaphobranchus kaupii TaxID=118154 RepID=A0A9Q1FQ83_SYNKA|nr:hypothetical protein SKAU_G00125590 [Synaphobranchus kaupii]